MKHTMQPISFNLKPSYLYAYSLVLIGLLSILSFSFSPIHLLLKIIWGILITFATVLYVLRDALRRLPSTWQQVQVDSKGELVLISNNGKRFKAIVKSSSYVSTYLTIILFEKLSIVEEVAEKHQFTASNKLMVWIKSLITKLFMQKIPIVILSKNANVDDIRRLKVWLLWWVHKAKS